MRAALAAVLGACAVLFGPAGAAMAQNAGTSATAESPKQRTAKPARTRPRVVVTPPRAYRQCVDWYAIERRATGNTVVPNMRCWWAYR